ncbi:hypothetical protein CRG98_034440 [Punica granatum]|uniref:Endonuclease/exonuclease/phosphatase domain-containing protein n=1 Tax=Punica granatum TaxID=22663 RepID=A0A2I0IMD8_PUNGR|nr:hypothetical protein CRG98_034440 [Punica granatum]
MAGDPTVRALRLLRNKYQPSMIFISETKIDSERCKKLGRRYKLDGIFSVDSSNSAGGLCLLWNTELKVQILQHSPHYIHALIDHAILPASWCITCVYGPPYAHLKHNFWYDLANLAVGINCPRMLIGDFNEICSSNDKSGGKPFASSSRPYLDDFMSLSGCMF